MEVVICGCQKDVSKRIEEILLEYENLFKVEIINNSDDLKYSDLCFLDASQIHLIAQFRRFNSQCMIIIISKDAHCVQLAFELKVFQYLIEPIDQDMIVHELRRAMECFNKENKNKIIKLEDAFRVINVDQIIYLESYYTDGQIHTVDRCYSTSYRIIREVKKELDSYYFINVHSGYLVNLKYIKSIRYNFLELSNGDILPVSKVRYKQIRDQILQYFKIQNPL